MAEAAGGGVASAVVAIMALAWDTTNARTTIAQTKAGMRSTHQGRQLHKHPQQIHPKRSHLRRRIHR